MAPDVLNRLFVIDDRTNPDFEERSDPLAAGDRNVDTRLLRKDRDERSRR
jgi:hypothetical protein